MEFMAQILPAAQEQGKQVVPAPPARGLSSPQQTYAGAAAPKLRRPGELAGVAAYRNVRASRAFTSNPTYATGVGF